MEMDQELHMEDDEELEATEEPNFKKSQDDEVEEV